MDEQTFNSAIEVLEELKKVINEAADKIEEHQRVMAGTVDTYGGK